MIDRIPIEELQIGHLYQTAALRGGYGFGIYLGNNTYLCPSPPDYWFNGPKAKWSLDIVDDADSGRVTGLIIPIKDKGPIPDSLDVKDLKMNWKASVQLILDYINQIREQEEMK